METVERTLQILRVLSRHGGDGLSVTQLGASLDLPPSSVHRILRLLLREDFVTQEAHTRRYGLGPEVLSMARAYVRGKDIVALARPYLAALRAETDETAFLTTLVGTRPICVAIEESTRPLRLFIEVGQVMPYHAAASARVILAYRSVAEARELLGAERAEAYTAQTPTSVEAVLELLDQVRAEGYALCDSELDEDTTAVAGPVWDAGAEVTASITLVAPAARLQRADRAVAVGLVRQTAAALSEALGYAPLAQDVSAG